MQVERTDFVDNQSIVALIDGRGGIFALLDEEIRMKGTGQTFLAKVKKQHVKNAAFALPHASQVQ
jgi:myosin heavy subunit